MIVTNKKTGVDVSSHYLDLMQGKITNTQFEILASIKEAHEQVSQDDFEMQDEFNVVEEECA